jgi:hypothetical protein
LSTAENKRTTGASGAFASMISAESVDIPTIPMSMIWRKNGSSGVGLTEKKTRFADSSSGGEKIVPLPLTGSAVISL